MKKNLLVLLTTLVFIGILIGVVELYCRLFTDINYLGNSTNLFIANAYGDSKGNTPNVEAMSFGAKVYTDKYGFRIAPKNKDTERQSAILILGDSVAFGAGVNNDKAFAGLLRARFPDTRIYNSAVIGYDLDDYLNVVNYFVPQHKEIKLVYLIYCLNDVTSGSAQAIDEYLAKTGNQAALKNLRTMQDLGQNGLIQSVNSFLQARSKLYVALKGNISDISLGILQYDMQFYRDADIQERLKTLSVINEELDSRGIQFVVAIPPYEAQLRFRDNTELMTPQRIVGDYLRSNRINYIDVAKYFTGNSRDLYLYHDAMHLSPKGHEIMLKILTADIVNHG